MKLHQHARKKCLALDKFDGNHEALMAWLKHNRIALYLGGKAIDHELPSKIMGAFFSIIGALCFFNTCARILKNVRVFYKNVFLCTTYKDFFEINYTSIYIYI